MKTFTFGMVSERKIATMHLDLQRVFKLAIQRSKIDFGISEGHRSRKKQKLLFDQGLSKIDGINQLGKHNLNPAEAGDIFIYHPDPITRRRIMYNPWHLSYVAGVIDACARELFEAGRISHLIRWGGNWDKDQVIALDQSFNDLPHFELYKP